MTTDNLGVHYEHLSAANLFHPFRLDLCVKFILFRSIQTGVLRETADALYRKHISARTGGHEPPDLDGIPSTKKNINDYVESARLLHADMSANGFNTSFPVPVGQKNLPLNGAHRIACARAIGLDVPVVRHLEDGYKWDFQWFEKNGFTKDELSLILKEYALLTAERSVIFVLWGPALKFWGEMTAKIEEEFDIAGHLDFGFGMRELAAFCSLIYDIYSHETYDHLHGMNHIDRKIDHLKQSPTFYRVIVATLPTGSNKKHWESVRRLKIQLRDDYANSIPIEQFITCHASESIDETQHMANTLLCPYNLAVLRHRRLVKPRAEFLKWLSEYSQKLRNLRINREDSCIVGSSTLEIMEIRQSTDIDFTVRKNVRDVLFNPKSKNLAYQLDIVTEGYHRLYQGTPFTDDILIDDPALHIRFRGLKFANISIVRDRKDYSARPKDVMDVELIDKYTLPKIKCRTNQESFLTS